MTSNSLRWKRNIRIIMFVLTILFIEAWRWGYRISLQANQGRQIAEIYNYVQCLILRRKKPFCRLFFSLLFLSKTPADCVLRLYVSATMTIIFLSFFFLRCLLASALFGFFNKTVWRHWITAWRQRSNPFSRSTMGLMGVTLSADGENSAMSITDG